MIIISFIVIIVVILFEHFISH